MQGIFFLPVHSCTDPDSFVRGGSTLTKLMREGESKYHTKLATIVPPAKRHLNGVSLACR